MRILISSLFRKRRISTYLFSFYTTTLLTIIATTAIVVWKFRDECYHFPIPLTEEHFKKCGSGNAIGKYYYDNKMREENQISFEYTKYFISENDTDGRGIKSVHRDLKTAAVGSIGKLDDQEKPSYEDRVNILEHHKEVQENVTQYFEEQRKLAVDACLKMFYNEESINLDTANEENFFTELKKLEKLEKGENRFFMQTIADKRTRWIFYKNPDPLNPVEIQWCPLYKAASTPFMAIFTKLSKALTPITEAKIRKGKITFLNLAKDFRLHIQKGEIKSVGENSQRFSMVVVRHPFQRILSAFRDKLERVKGREYYHTKYSKKIIKKFRQFPNIQDVRRKGNGKPLWYQMALDLQYRYGKRQYSNPTPTPVSSNTKDTSLTTVNPKIINTSTTTKKAEFLTGPTFEEFCRYLLSVDPKSMDEHWRPQYLDCSPCHHKFDLILKVEELEESRQEVFKLLGYENSSSEEYIELDQIWKRWTNPTAHEHDESFYFSQLTQKIMQDLYHVYELDFELFGYSADEYFDMAKQT